MTATVVPTEVATYLAAVREALSDLGAEERDDLLVEVESSLIETAGEDGRPIAVRLGPPAEFAAELRASAGLPPAAPPPAPTAPGLLAAVRAAVVQAGADPRLRAAGRVLGELAPIWWVARAYVAVVVVAKVAGADWSFAHPAIPRIGGSGQAAAVILAVAVAVAVSIALGLRERHRRRPSSRAGLAVNLLLAVAAIPAGIYLIQTATAAAPRDVVVVGVPAASPGVSHDGVPVSNIYPYTRDGRLLHDVLLFDDLGRPLDIQPGDTDPTRRLLTAADGQKIFDSFPIRYFEPGTTRVANASAAPPLRPPSLFTPPARRPAAPARSRR